MLGIMILLLAAIFFVLKFCKFKMFLSILICLAALYCVIFTVDKTRVESFREPIFHISYGKEGGLTEYRCLGYRTVVRYGYIGGNNEMQITSIEMYMFDKCIAAAVE